MAINFPRSGRNSRSSEDGDTADARRRGVPQLPADWEGWRREATVADHLDDVGGDVVAERVDDGFVGASSTERGIVESEAGVLGLGDVDSLQTPDGDAVVAIDSAMIEADRGDVLIEVDSNGDPVAVVAEPNTIGTDDQVLSSPSAGDQQATEIATESLVVDSGDEVAIVYEERIDGLSVADQPGASTDQAAPPADLDPYPDVDVDDGNHRRKRALIIVGVALLAGALGMLIGRRIQSPADRAASQAAPEPSLITVAVERRELSSELVLNGEVAYNEPITIQLAGPVGIDTDEKAILTAVPVVGDEVTEGKSVLEVTNRPVIALQGTLPMYRTITVGTTGPDVAQLEAALKRMGFDPGTVDETADAATLAAVVEMYGEAGFPAPTATSAEAAAVTAAKQAVADAQANLASSRTQLKDASAPLSGSERMELDHAVTEANDAVPAARAAVDTVTAEQNGLVAAAVAERDSANRAVADVQTLYNQARSGAVNPETGEPYSSSEIAGLAQQLAEATSAAAAAQAAVGTAEAGRTRAIAEANAAVDAAEFQRDLAQVRRDEQTKSAGSDDAASAVTNAEAALTDAQAELTKAQAAAGPRLPAGEVIFVPSLPANLTEWYTTVGSEATGQMGSIASAATQVTARISRTDTNLVPVGAKVTVEVREADFTTTGVVKSVGEPAAQQQSNDEFGGSEPSNDGRLEVVVEPDDPDAIAEFVMYSARVIVEVESTDSEQLVVPVAALSVGPEGEDRVEVERSPATDDKAAETEMVAVKVGLTANGLAAVTPIDADLAENDRVVIGFDYPDRRVESENTAGGDVTEGSAAESDNKSDGKSDDGDNSDGDSSSEGSLSPLDQFLGGAADPVAQREQMLAVEEAIAKCMTAEGFEYTPVDYGADTSFQDYTDPQFGSKYGYGVVYGYETYQSEDADPAAFNDPNEEYVSGLSETEMNQYYEALWGSQIGMVDEGDGTEMTMPPLEDQGCWGKAQLEVVGDSPLNDEAVWTRLDELQTQSLEDPEATKLFAAWSDCMSEPLTAAEISPAPDNPEGMYSAVEAKLYLAQGGKVVEFANQQEADQLTQQQDFSSMSQNSDGSGFIVTGELTALSSDQIESLRQQELELWNADQACQKDVGLDEYRNQQEAKIVEQLQSEFPDAG